MFKLQTRYTIIAITGIAFIGCSSPKTITIKPNTTPIIAGARTIRHQAPIIEEEVVVNPYQRRIETRVEVPQNVVVHEEPKRVPIVTVPKNHPILGVKVDTDNNNNSSSSNNNITTAKNVDRLNGETMERIPFPADEYRSLKKIGRSTVSGRVFIVNSMTDKEVIGSGLKLYLNPVTSYSAQWYNESYLSGYKMSKVDKRLYNYLKFSTSNNNGKFDFFGIAKGKYYLIGSMMCGEECGLSSREKIRLVKEIYVGSGVTKIELTKRVP